MMTLPILGQTLMFVACAAAVVGAWCNFRAGRALTHASAEMPVSRSEALGARAIIVVLLAALGGCLALLLALVASDFTLSYVQQRTSRDLSLGFRITALWSGQEGSLLLWLTVLAACGALMSRTIRRAGLSRAHRSYSAAVVLTIAAFFASLVAFVARPFEVVDQLQRDGAGMSPSLQNYWMAAHPPTLYLGYVGVSIPFAIVMGALLSRQREDTWVPALRGWVLASWMFLTMGLVLGARWAYEEIGWGGYWAWDPVENAALMPWLTATALLHSIMVQQRRGMMRFWNAVLASLTFGLSIFGTFLTRSGVLSSVHSFVSSPVGWWFIGALAVLIAATLVVLFRSRDLLRAHHDVDSVVSREALLLFNNLLLVSLALVVLWGVLYPILTAAFTNSRVSLEKPWYDFFATAFGLPLVFLLACAPIIAWQGTPLRRVMRQMLHPVAWSLALGTVLIAAGLGSSPSGVAAVCLGSLVIFGVIADMRRSIVARAAAQRDEGAIRRVLVVAARLRRRWGAWLAHAGIGLVIIAIAGGAWGDTATRELRSGDAMRVGAYTLTFQGTDRKRTTATMQTRATFAIRRGGHSLGTVRAGRDFHPASGEASNEVAVRRDWVRMLDVFVNVDQLTEDGVVRAKVFVNPLVPLLWFGGIVTVFGALLAAVPGRPSRRELSGPDTNEAMRVEGHLNAVHELCNRAPAPGELLSGLRSPPSGSGH